MFVFESIDDNTELRDNILNEEIDDTSVFSGLDSETASSIIKSVQGVGFDTKGNVLGNDGKVVIEANQLRDHLRNYYSQGSDGNNDINPSDYESIEIDGVALTINDKGEAVNGEGVVVKTSEQVKAIIAENANDAEPDTIEAIIAAANEGLGIEFKDEEGNALEFDLNTVAGVQARDQYIINTVAAKMAKETVDGVFKTDSDFESLYLYKKQHGTSKGWTPTPDYNSIKLLEAGAEGADAQHLDVIIKSEIARGSSPDRAKIFAQYLIDDGKGEEAAKEGLDFLNKNAAKALSDAQERDRLDSINQAKELEVYWGRVKETINSGEVKGIKIPAFIPIKQADGSTKMVPRNAVYEFMSKPINEKNQSAWQVHNSTMTDEDRIIDALMKMTNYGHADVVRANVSNEKIKLIRKMKDANARTNRINNVGGKAANEMVVL